ncbi:MAG: amino acid ABC transporter permease [Nitratireductor sp.]|nr:amino acid ABC transporter permease [Nitratireductor sp.]
MSQSNTPRTSFVRTEMVGAEPAPASEVGVVGWMRHHLFSSIPNTILTIFAIYLVWVIVPPLLDFALFSAVWSGENREACTTLVQGGVQLDGWAGACWPYIGDYISQFIYGRYPFDQIWRVNLVFFLFVVGLVPILIPSVPYKRENAIYLFGAFPVLAFILLSGGNIDLNGFLLPDSVMAPGFAKFIVDFLILTAVFCLIGYGVARGTDSPPMPMMRGIAMGFAILLVVILLFGADFGLETVETEQWGGLLVTLVIAVTGITASLPIGIVLALGRRSQMPAVRLFSVIFIEFWRGVPLITVLFMSSVMLPLFLPEGVTFDKLLRALIGVALFSAAYMAEVVRGGIQALPKGQYEGAMALGLSYWQMMQFIILPQALKLVIPGIVNSFIALFKDTTLVLIIGLFDFLGMIQSSYSDSTWASPVQSLTGYLFAALVYWLFCFSMSRYSLFMEKRLDTSRR